MRGVWRPADGRSRLSPLMSAHRFRGDGVATRDPSTLAILLAGAAGGAPVSRVTSRRSRADRFSWLQLVDRAESEEARHSRLLLLPSSTLGLGFLARQQDASAGGPCSLLPPL